MKNSSINIISKLKEIYDNGGNIIKYLKNENNRKENTLEDILISYDFQSGKYIEIVTKDTEYIIEYSRALVEEINKLGSFKTILEVGVGECTTLANVICELNNDQTRFLGFDISWSRIHYGFKYLKMKNQSAKLFVGDLFNIPLPDSSIDVIYTSHSLEPNGGKEREALIELFRVAKKYIVLLEPTNQFATEEGKRRMMDNGYIQNLDTVINDLGYELLEFRKFDVIANPLNPTGMYIIRKNESSEKEYTNEFNCPISNTPLKEYDDHFFSDESLISYPKINQIPCLYPSYGILTSKHNY